MGENIFDKYRKDFKKEVLWGWKAFWKLPAGVTCPMILMFVFAFLAVLLVFVPDGCAMVYLLFIADIITLGITHYQIEKYIVDCSEYRLRDNLVYYEELKEWLESFLMIVNIEAVCAIIVELKECVETSDKEIRAGNEMFVGVVKIILIPLFITLITAVINDTESWQSKIFIVLAVMLMILLVVPMGWTAYSLVCSLRGRKNSLRREFIKDLQGVIDTQFEDSLLRVRREV